MNGRVGCLIKMPNKCCVFGCNSNYATTEERVSVFSFSKDKILKLQWIRKIPNQNVFGRFHLQMTQTNISTLYLYAFLFTLSAWLCDVTFSQVL